MWCLILDFIVRKSHLMLEEINKDEGFQAERGVQSWKTSIFE